MYIPHVETIDQRLMSRFLAKASLEILTHSLIETEGWEQEILGNEQLEPLRRFARIGDKPPAWPFSRRRIYGEDDMQQDGPNSYQVLHEFTLLYTPKCELYAVICIFGEEFAINCAGPDIEGYANWLKEYDNRSPLYWTDKLPVPPVIA
jgi:hypothetical protein